MALLIAVPFILVSFIMGFWAKKHTQEKSFRRFILLALTIACLLESTLTQMVSVIQSSFIGALACVYMANLMSNKYIVKFLEIFALTLMLLAGFLQGVEAINLAITALFVILSYYCLNNYKNEVALSVVQIVPIGLAGLYFKTDFIPFILTFMTLFGCVRYFIEAKQTVVPKFFIQSYLVIIMLLLNSFTNTEFLINFTIIFAASSFMLLSHALQSLLKHKHAIITRLYDQHEIRFVLTIKLFAFNMSAMILGFVYKLDYINIYVLVGYITAVLFYGFAKMWYKENEHNFKF